ASLHAGAERLGSGIQAALTDAGIVARTSVVGSLVGLHLGPEVPVDYESARRTDEQGYAALFHAALDRGVAFAPGAYEVMFPGLAHDDAVIDRIVEVVADAA